MTTLGIEDYTALRRQSAGTVLTPADHGYDAARTVWNGGVDRYPALIAQAGGPADVATALEFARQHGLAVSVKGGGHNMRGDAVCDDGLVIDLSALRAITVNATARTIHCGGGCTWAEVDAAGQQVGLAVPGGTVSDTGVGGLTLGGGVGWLTARHGLTVDNLLSAEVVTADGVARHASADEHPDLFWALRGGGGNFGVVTRFEFRAHPVGPIVQLGLFFWPIEQGTGALRFIRDTVVALPPGMGAMIAGLNAPPAPFVPPEVQQTPGYALVVAGFDGPEQHAGVVAEVRSGPPAAFELVSPIPYVELQKLIDPGSPRGMLSYEKALYVDTLSDEVLDVIAEYQPQKSAPLSITPIFPLRDTYTTVPDDATAFGGTRAPKFAVNVATMAPDPELYATDRAWVRRFWTALAPHASSTGGYVNFMADYDEDRVRAAYGATKFDRLSRIKAGYDPDNVFRPGANIRPAVDA
ncbi:FAD-binding oxidoreductase [Amycolatopsis sp. NPDC051903]|uniref:FAD-binding oxidoreductase n=1 Tax=Amycolatopsis sp. NPDC051903 TaxID=3363936 RepID=UPI0037BDE2C2